MSVEKFAVKSMKDAIRTRRAIIIALFSSVVMDTPVLTGRLRGNWQLTEGSPASGTLAREDKSGGATLSEINKLAKGTDGEQFLANNLPYAETIEYDGWSWQKAPDGMVRRNVVRIEQIVEEQTRNNKS